MFKQLIKIDYGNSFKGHTANLLQINDGLQLNQCYFSSNQYTGTYSIKNNETVNLYVYNAFYTIPKWYFDLSARLKNLGLPNKLIAHDEDIEFTMYVDGHVSLYYTETTSGINFNNHKYNIDQFKKLSHKWGIIRSNLQTIKNEDFNSFKIKESMNGSSSELIIPNQIFL